MSVKSSDHSGGVVSDALLEAEARPNASRVRESGQGGGEASRSEVIASDERESRLERFHFTAHGVPHVPLPDLFESQAARTPQRVAVVLEDESLCYGEL